MAILSIIDRDTKKIVKGKLSYHVESRQSGYRTAMRIQLKYPFLVYVPSDRYMDDFISDFLKDHSRHRQILTIAYWDFCGNFLPEKLKMFPDEQFLVLIERYYFIIRDRTSLINYIESIIEEAAPLTAIIGLESEEIIFTPGDEMHPTVSSV